MEKNLVLDVNENPKKVKDWVLFAIQHILAMLVACITVPQITGLPVGATLVSAGIGTLIYILVTKRKSPVFLSSSFAYLAPMAGALALGEARNISTGLAPHMTRNYLAVMIGMALVGLVYVIIALVVKAVGTKWINKLLPPVVVGPIIMVIGLSLAGSAINNVTGGTYIISSLTNAKEFVSWYHTLISIGIAFIACFVTAICAHYGNGKMLGLIPFVIGMGSAYLVALLLSIIGFTARVPALKIINFDMFTAVDWSSVGAYLNVTPDKWMLGLAITENSTFSWAELGQTTLLFIPVALVTVCEHIGDHKNLGNIINKDLLNEEPGMTRTLIGDGIATAVSGSLCGAANTTYGENVAVIGVTKIASVGVIILASLMSIAFGMLAPLTLVLSSVPSCITGGVSLILYGFIASSGVKMLIKEKVDFNVTKNIIVASIILVVGIGGLVLGFGDVYKNGVPTGDYVIQITSTAVAMILGIVFNLILKEPKKVEE